jgi:pyridoxal phosphate enzyme (YggS family)
MDEVASAARDAGRDPGSVTVVAVSKTKSPEEVMDVYEQGHRDFGENRAAELAEKAGRLPTDIRWHFVGALQSNKVRLVRGVTHLLHSVDRESLGGAWVKGPGLPPPVLVQVDLAGEEQKSGTTPERAGELVENLVSLGLEVRGLMAIPPAPERPEDSRPYFAALRRLRDRLGSAHPRLTELSMGMTDDFGVAISEGASIIRVGRAIFGDRT